MRKSNNYFKFFEYVTYGKDHDDTIDKGNGVLECKSYVSISDIEYRYNTTFGLENDWLTFKNILIKEDTLYIYYLDGENSALVGVYLLDNFKTQKELKETITIACTEFAYDILLEKSEVREEATEETNDGCKTVKEVMKVKQELNARFGKEQYFDTDSLQPNKTITAKIENINHCLNQNICCIVSPFVHCDYKYKSDACNKAHKKFIHDCEQVHKQMKARSNPEWHHVNLETFRNIDFDMLDEKRKLVLDINHILKDGIRNLYKCENHISFEVLERYVIRKCDELIRHNRLKAFWFSYIARQLDEVRRNTIYLYTPYITAHRNR